MEQRRPSFAAPNSAAKQDKLPQQSAPDTANFLEFACNVSSVFSPPTFNTSNVRGNAELSEIPWLLYDFVQFLFGVLLPFVYGILKRCGARVLFEMLINTHIGDEFNEADVVKAFTHAELDEQIYMAPPEGYERVVRLVFAPSGLLSCRGTGGLRVGLRERRAPHPGGRLRPPPGWGASRRSGSFPSEF